MKKRTRRDLAFTGLRPSDIAVGIRAHDVIVTPGGHIETRDMLGANTVSATNEWINGIAFMFGTEKYYAGFTGTKVSHIKTSDSTCTEGSALTASTEADFAEYGPNQVYVATNNPLAILTSSSNPLQYIHDNSGIDLDESALTYNATVKIRPACVCEHRKILFLANVYEDAHYPNRLRWTGYAMYVDGAANLDAFGDGSYGSYEDIGEKSDPIVRILSFQNELFIFKRRSVWLASGISSDVVAPEYIRKVLDFGLVNPRAVVVAGKLIHFVSDGGLCSFDGSNSKFQFEWLRNVIYKATSSTVVPATNMQTTSRLAYDKAKERLFWGIGNICATNYGYLVWDNKEWTHWFKNGLSDQADMTHNFIFNNVDRTTVGSVTGSTGVILMSGKKTYAVTEPGAGGGETTTSDWSYESDWLDFGRTVKPLALEIEAEASAATTVTVNVYLDYSDSSQTTATISLTAKKSIPHFIDLDASCDRLKVEIKGAASPATKVRIISTKIAFKPGSGI